MSSMFQGTLNQVSFSAGTGPMRRR